MTTLTPQLRLRRCANAPCRMRNSVTTLSPDTNEIEQKPQAAKAEQQNTRNFARVENTNENGDVATDCPHSAEQSLLPSDNNAPNS